jgi:acetyl-CoA synthetase (ADP-forming)
MPADFRIGVDRMLAPRAVAVIGASNTPGKFGYGIMLAVTGFGYAGQLYPINPKPGDIMERPSYRSIAAAPGPVDIAIIALPPQQAVQACRDAASAGVGACVVVTTGFAELGEAGAALEAELTELARATGMRIIGPNCMGLIAPACLLPLTSSVVFDSGGLLAGRIGLISQSGGLMVSIYDRAVTDGIGFSACVSLGNQCDVEFSDILAFMLDDKATAAICLYVEGLKSPKRFLELARACRSRGKPLLMVKAGRTEAGMRAAMSHTASLAGAYSVLAVACREAGVLLMDDVDDMIRAANTLVRFGRPLPGGIGLISTSGGSITLGVDRLYESGLTLAALTPDSVAAMAPILLPGYAQNPVDLGGRRDDWSGPQAAARLVEILAADDGVSVLLVILNTSRPYAALSEATARALLACGKPFVVVFTPGQAADLPRAALRALDCPYFDNADSALRVLVSLAEAASQPPQAEAAVRPAGLPVALPDLPVGRLTEPEVKALVAAYGVPVTAERLCITVDETVAAGEAIGFPVAVKAVCRDLLHKSDVGAVRLAVRDAAALRVAFAEVKAAVAAALPGSEIQGVLVQAMWPGPVELLVGAKREPGLGAVVVVGLGGTSVELFGDIQMAMAPVSPAQATALLRRLRCWPLLDGWRGKPALDVAAAAAAISRLSWLAHELGDRLVDIELNPVMVRAGQGGVCAVDARATLAD